jgi:hypothetical protein
MTWILDAIRTRKRERRREETRREIEALGFRLDRMPGPTKRYELLAPWGEKLDNGGMGYASSHEALKAARKHGSSSGSS